jgi:cytoplasmic iron level regulating protein YaaA (DUF328/UPF0246 family)
MGRYPLTSEPHFQSLANENAVQLASYSADELKGLLRVNDVIAQENWKRYQHFFDEEEQREPAVFAYDGMVFRKLAPESMSMDDLGYANSHLLIASFLYGLLRPLDLVRRYRLEGDVVLPEHRGLTMFDYWKPLLTDYLIARVKADDGILVNLASDEMKKLVCWPQVEREVEVISPQFRLSGEGKRRMPDIYTKMCRGAMARYILTNRIVSPSGLCAFEYEGFRYDASAEGFQYCME